MGTNRLAQTQVVAITATQTQFQVVGETDTETLAVGGSPLGPGATPWSDLSSPTGNLTLNLAGFSTIFSNGTQAGIPPANNSTIFLTNPDAGVSNHDNASPALGFQASGWTGSTSVPQGVTFSLLALDAGSASTFYLQQIPGSFTTTFSCQIPAIFASGIASQSTNTIDVTSGSTTALAIVVNSPSTPVGLSIVDGGFANTAALLTLTQLNGTDSGAALVISNAGTGNDITGTNSSIAQSGKITSTTHVLTAATPTTAAGQVGFGTTTATSATAGSNGDVPAQVVGYLEIDLAGTKFKIPYYAV